MSIDEVKESDIIQTYIQYSESDCINIHKMFLQSQFDRRDHSDIDFVQNIYKICYGDSHFNALQEYLNNPTVYCATNGLLNSLDNAIDTVKTSNTLEYEQPSKEDLEYWLTSGIQPQKTLRSICVILECDDINIHNLFEYYFKSELYKMHGSYPHLYYLIDCYKFSGRRSSYYLRVTDPAYFIHFNVYYPWNMLNYLTISFPITYEKSSPRFSYIYGYF